MLYLTDCSHTYATNNRLEEKVSQLMISASRRLIKPEDLDGFKSYLLNRIEMLNQQHPKCKPVKIAFELDDNYPNRLKDYVIRWNNFPNSNGKHIVQFEILASREDAP
jgi:hypothetical protein